MKKKWLIGLISALMAVTLCFGFAACGDSADDNATLKRVLDTLRTTYNESPKSTPSDYDVLAFVPIEKESYDISWSATAVTEGVTISDYVTIGEPNKTANTVKIGITQGTIDVDYKLKASVTVGSVSGNVEFSHTVPAAVLGDVNIDFAELPLGDALNTATLEAAIKEHIDVAEDFAAVTKASYVYAGNNSNNGGPSDYREKGGFIKTGTGSYNGEIELSFTKFVEKVQIVCMGWSASDTISINGATAETMGNTDLYTATYTVPDAATAKVTDINIVTAKRALLFKIAVTFVDGAQKLEYTYSYNTDTPWTHTKTETHNQVAAESEPCTPVDNVCRYCSHTFSQSEILEKFAALQENESLPGTYKLTGYVTHVVDTYEGGSDFKNAEFWLLVGDMEFEVYRATTPDEANYAATALKVGATVTINGGLTNYKGTLETATGTTFADVKDEISTLEEATKIAIAKASVKHVTTEYKEAATNVQLPTSICGITVTWTAAQNNCITIDAQGKMSVTLPAEGASDVTVQVTAQVGSDTANTVTLTFTVKAPTSGGEEPEPDASGFTRLESATAGDFIFSAKKNDKRLYASDNTQLDGGDTGYIKTTENAAEAVKLTIEQKAQSTTEWYIKMGSKYLEIHPYPNGTKVSYKLRLVSTPNTSWTWDNDIKIFKQVPVATEDLEGKTASTDYYYIGTYNGSNFDTLSPSSVTFITGDKASALDTTQHPGRFGTIEELTDQVKAQQVADAITAPESLTFYSTDKDKQVTLTTSTTLSTQYSAKITWSVSSTLTNYITVTNDTNGSKLTVTALPTDAAVTGKLIATVTIGEGAEAKTATHEFDVTVNKADAVEAAPQVLQPTETAPESGDYYLGMKIGYGWYYFAGSESGNYLATTTDVEEAAVVTITKDGDNYTLKVNNKFIEVINSGDYYNAKLPTSQTSGQVWKWNAQYKIFTMSVEGTDYFLGTYTSNGSTRTTIGASAVSYAGNNTNILAKVGALGDGGDEDKAWDILKSFTLDDVIYSEANTNGIALPTSNRYGATVTWAVQSATQSDVVSVNDNTLKILKLATDTDAKITLKVTVEVGEGSIEKEFIIFVEPPVPTAPGSEATTIEVTIASYASTHNQFNGASADLDNNITATADKTSNGQTAPAYNTQWRLYANNTITFTAKYSATIYSIVITYDNYQGGTLYNAVGKPIASGTTIYVNGTSIVLTVSSSGQARITAITVVYTGGAKLSDEDIANNALEEINVTVKELTENYKLPESSVPGITLNWSIEGDVGESGNEAAKIEAAQGGGKQITVNRKATDVTFTLKVTATYNGKTTQPKSFPNITVKRALKEGENVLNFVNFTGFSSWGNAYSAHTINFSDVGGTVSGTVEIDNANKQSNTMKDRPCIGAKNAGTTGHVTVKLTEASKEFSEIKFNMYGYGSKTFDNIWIEYSENGTDGWTLLGTKSGEVKTAAAGTYTYTATSIPAGTKYVRLVISTTSTSATQIGLTSIEFTVKDSAPAAASIAYSAPVADLPNKD